MEPHGIREILLDVAAESLEAQLKAIRRLQDQSARQGPPKKGMSQVDMVQDILASSHSPLHINDILTLIQQRFGVCLDRESLVSALTKKIRHHDRFIRTAKNTFALKEGE